MEEIKVVVQQEAACINFNYAEIKQQLEEQMEIYKGMEYTDDTIKEAKTDRATLNKLSKEIDDRRKAVKKEYNKPLDAFESQVKDLLSIIKEPIEIIDSKVKDYEAAHQGSLVPGILQARTLEWVAISFSNA